MKSGSLWNVIEIKLMMLMIMLHMVNHLNIKQKQQEKHQKEDGSQPSQPEQPAQPPVPTLNVEVTTPLKYLSDFWRFLDLPLINCEIELHLKHNSVTGATFQVNNAKLLCSSFYVVYK